MGNLFEVKNQGIAIHEVYEHAVNNLSMFSPAAQKLVRENIASLDWMDEMLDKDRIVTQIMIDDTVGKINRHEGPVDIFSFSALIYKCKLRGYNVQPLIDVMHANGEWLTLKQIEDMNLN